MLQLSISWQGPFTSRQVQRFNDGGVAPDYEGEDYGLYQIYGRHVLGGRDALLYVGSAIDQTFAARFRQHEAWLLHEWPVTVYLGRMYLVRRHTASDAWARWREDLLLAERLLIYKYSPHYNSSSIAERPLFATLKRVVLVHEGQRHRLRRRDVAPDDWE
jgi:hypothetical protein